MYSQKDCQSFSDVILSTVLGSDPDESDVDQEETGQDTYQGEEHNVLQKEQERKFLKVRESIVL